jgi:hypothetical protein
MLPEHDDFQALYDARHHLHAMVGANPGFRTNPSPDAGCW